MRNLRCCLAITALALSVTSCQREHKPAHHPEAPPPEEYPPTEQAHPEEHEVPATPPPSAQAPSGHPGMGQAGPRVMRTTHDWVVDALVCGLPPASSAATVGPRGGGPSMQGNQPGMSMQARCNSLAPNVSAQDFSQLDEISVSAVRDAIERRAAEERLDDAARLHMLALFDRGIEAEREAMQAMQIADRYSVFGATPTAQSSAPPSRRIHAEIEPAALATLSSRDRLQDLLLFSRASGSGALSTEAEALAWVLATDRFLQVETLAPPVRVFAAEPLFESMLGVPTPQQAQMLDINRVNRQVWSQYLETAARAAEMMPSAEHPSGQRMQPGSMERSQAEPRAEGMAQPPGPPHGPMRGNQAQAAPGGPAMSPEEQKNMQRIVTLISQRMEALSRRMPASDLRMTLDSYAAELRTQPVGIGGGPQQQKPREQQRPQHQQPMQGPSQTPGQGVPRPRSQ